MQKGKEFCGSTVCVAGSFITPFFTFFRFRFFMFNLVKVVVFVRLPEAVEKIVKSTNTGSVIGMETTKDGVQGSDFKPPAPFRNGIGFQYGLEKIGTEQTGRETCGGFARQGIKFLHNGIRFREIGIPGFHNDIPCLFRYIKGIVK